MQTDRQRQPSAGIRGGVAGLPYSPTSSPDFPSFTHPLTMGTRREPVATHADLIK